MILGRIWGTLDPFLETGPILGRRVANLQFLRALLRADPFDEYHFFIGDRAARESLGEHLGQFFPDLAEQGKLRLLDRRNLPRALAEHDYHCFHQSDCITHPPHLARLRNAASREIFPVTGPIHSLSYANYGALLLAHLWPGATPRDCIVTTSSAGRDVVERFFEGLRSGYDLSPGAYPGPSLRRIPLAVDTGDLQPVDRDGRRIAREKLDLDTERTWLLVFGRVSHYSKMDLLPLLRAFQRLFAEGVDPKSVGLLLGGWTEDGDEHSETLRAFARNIGLELRLFPRPGEIAKLDLYRAADVFVSIADNPQETFGLTVLEAMAMGLPVLASDYDGYKDTVAHGETGLLVPTLGPSATPALDDLAPLLYDNQYHLLLAQQTAVEVPALAAAVRRLLDSPEARAAMGAAGRLRVEDRFSWPVVVAAHVALWEELWTLPVDPAPLRDRVHPSQVAYGRIFGGYPTRALRGDDILTAGRTGEAIYRRKDHPVVYAGLEGVLDEKALGKLPFLARNPLSADELAERVREAFPALSPDRIEFLLLWALKQDILERREARTS